MSVSTLVDRVKIIVTSSGTGPFALGSAVPAFRGREALVDGVQYNYAAENGSLYEVGTGVYQANTGHLIRTPTISSNGGGTVGFPAGVELSFTVLAADLIRIGVSLPIVQATGDDPNLVMSQRAVTQGLAYSPTGLYQDGTFGAFLKSGGYVAIPPGVTELPAAAGGDLSANYTGPGQVQTTDGHRRAKFFSAIKAAPTSFGSADSVDTAFDGDWSHSIFSVEHRVTGAATLGQPSTGYSYTDEAVPFFGYLFNTSGWNQSTSGNDGRTAACFFRIKVDNYGQGDAVAYNAAVFVSGAKAGATSFLANPAGSLFNGDLTAGSDGVYLNPYETIARDGGHDVAHIGTVVNGERTNDTGALGAWWSGARYQSVGSKAWNNVISAIGKFNAGLDLAMTDFGTHRTAISLAAGQRVSFNNASSTGNFTDSFNGDYIEYELSLSGLDFVTSGASRFQVTDTQVAVNQIRFLANNKVAMTGLLTLADNAAAIAAGLVAGECYINSATAAITSRI